MYLTLQIKLAYTSYIQNQLATLCRCSFLIYQLLDLKSLGTYFEIHKITIYVTTVCKNLFQRKQRTLNLHWPVCSEICCPINHFCSLNAIHRSQNRGLLILIYKVLSCPTVEENCGFLFPEDQPTDYLLPLHFKIQMCSLHRSI